MRSRIRYAVVAILIASVPVVLTLLATRGEADPGTPVEPLWQAAAYGAARWYPWVILAALIDRRIRRSRPRTRADRARVFGGHALLVATFMLTHGVFMNV